MVRAVAPLLCLLLLGCRQSPEDTRASDLSGHVTDELEFLLGALADLDLAAASLPDQVDPVASQACEDHLSNCEHCWDLEGTLAGGSFTGATTETPCGATGSNAMLVATVLIDDTTLSGTWTGDATTGTYELTGSREASLAINTPVAGARSYDTSWTLDSLEAVYVRGTPSPLELDLTFPDFGGAEWRVRVEVDGNDVDGTINGPSNCSIGGSAERVGAACN
jgi:hypothetical protein